jgi:hypothetical protein
MPTEAPAKLIEAMKMLRRLHLLTAPQKPQLQKPPCNEHFLEGPVGVEYRKVLLCISLCIYESRLRRAVKKE